MIGEKTLKQYLDEVASDSPTPGGGNVSAMTGALAAALACMVCNLTIGRKRYQKVEDEIKDVFKQTEKLRMELEILAEKDSEAFEEVISAYRLPYETDEQKEERRQAVQEALKKAALVPMDVLRRMLTLAELIRVLARKGNENSISDSGTAAYLCRAAAEGASLNVLINLATITDEDFVGKVKSEQEKLLRQVKDVVKDVEEIVCQKI